MEAYQERVLKEKAELDERLAKLLAFLHGETFLNLTEVERSRLRQQARWMDGYSAVLTERILAFPVEGNRA